MTGTTSRPNSNPILDAMRDDFGGDSELLTALAWAFGVAEVLNFHGEDIPDEMGYRPSPSGSHDPSQTEEYPDVYIFEMTGQHFPTTANVAELQTAGRCLARYVDWCKLAGQEL